MDLTGEFRFPPFRLDVTNELLWREREEIPLRPKTFAVLRYLVEHAGELVTKAALQEAVWPDTVVSDVAPGVCVQELRRALGDDRHNPRFIATVHRRGYRFVSPLHATPRAADASARAIRAPDASTTSLSEGPLRPAPGLVGREEELARLEGTLGRALHGERQIVFVTGEPGIGKTSLVEAFLERVETQEHALSRARGQCIEHFGAGEPYLPVLEALGRLGRGPDRSRLVEVLRHQAPTWLPELPALQSPAELPVQGLATPQTTHARMLRELTEALEAFTTERGLVLWLEDLHWSDVSTLDWLSLLGRRREPARLLVVASYRPVEVIVQDHPLRKVKQELQLQGLCQELPLDLLTASDVGRYLATQFDVEVDREAVRHLAQAVHRRTDGNPLFMVTVVDSMVAQGEVTQRDGEWLLPGRGSAVEPMVPEGLREMIEQQIERLGADDQKLLEVASVAGGEFSAAVAAALLGVGLEEVEERCAQLTRRSSFLRASGTAEWPDGTRAARYGFRHSLYREVVYRRLNATQRARFHQQVGERIEQAYGDRAREIAAELAMHFERGRELQKAVRYIQSASGNALQRSAHSEAIELLTRGLELLESWPDDRERRRRECSLRIALGVPLMAAKGYAAPEVATTYERARELCVQEGDTSRLFRVLLGLYAYRLNRAELRAARALADELLGLAGSRREPALEVVAHMAAGTTLFLLGEFADARSPLEEGIAGYESQPHALRVLLSHSNDVGVACLSYSSWALWVLGYPDQAFEHNRAALTLARELAHPFSQAYALHAATQLHQLGREQDVAGEHAEALRALSSEHEFPLWLAMGTISRGSALASQGHCAEGIAQLRDGLAGYAATGASVWRPYHLALLAQALGETGRVEEGLGALAEAFETAERTGERWYEAELYRLKGELLLATPAVSGATSAAREESRVSARGVRRASDETKEAETCLSKAVETARAQGARSFELRATTSLTRLSLMHGTTTNGARNALAASYESFREGLDTPDLRTARTLLEQSR